MRSSFRLRGDHVLPIAALIAVLAAVESKQCLADEKEVAKATFDRAVELFTQEDYRAALTTFEDSYRIYPRASTLFNIGMCQKALLLNNEAISTFELFLSDQKSFDYPALREEAKASLEQLEKLFGKLYVAGAPDGATLIIDGLQIGATSGVPMRLPPGSHAVMVEAKGHKKFEAQVTIDSARETRLEVKLESEQMPPEAPPVAIFEQPAVEPSKETGSVLREAPNRGPKRWLLRAGWITSSGVGLAFVSAGVYFGLKYNELVAAGLRDNETLAALAEDGLWDAEVEDHRLEIEEERLPEAKRGMVVGYSVGGALLAAGISMMLVDILKNKSREERRIGIAPGGAYLWF